MRRLALVFAFALGACGGSSPYDHAWVEGNVARTSGHAVRHVDDDDPATLRLFAPSLPPGVARVDALSEDDATAVALWNSATFRADLEQLGVARADLAAAAALPNPTFSFLLPIGTRQAELSTTYPIGALLQRPYRIAAAKADVERVARGLVQSGIDFVRDVRVAWAELAAAEAKRVLLADAASLVKESAALATERLEAGDATRIEAESLATESLATYELADRATHDEAVARARLRFVLGLAESPLGVALATKKTSDARTHAPPSLAEAERVALAARPDVRAAEIGIEAAGERLGLERAKIVQVVARLDAKPVGTRGGSPTLWLPGANLEIPLFDQNQAGRARSTAEIRRAAFAYLAKRQEVLTDVRAAHEEVAMARASLDPWTKEIVPRLAKNLDATTKAYAIGGEAHLAVLEATRRLVDARLRVLGLELDLRRARARLDRAVGWRIDAAK